MAVQPIQNGQQLSEKFERVVARHLQRLLGRASIDREATFSNQGADDLSLLRLLSKLHQEHPRIHLAWRDVANHGTVAGLAQRMATLASEQQASDSPAPTIREQFLQANTRQRVSLLKRHLGAEVAAQISAKPLAISLTKIEQSLHTYPVLMALTWAMKRDFQMPVYAKEICAASTLAELAWYFSQELHRHLGLRRLQARKPTKSPTNSPVKLPTKLPAQLPASANPFPERPNQPRLPAEERAANVVLLLSAPRSGSTLLRLMLGGHSRLFCPPELNLLNHAGLASWLQNRLRRYPPQSNVVQNLMALMGFSQDESARFISAASVDKPPPLELSTAALYQRVIQRAGKPTLVDKTPSYAKRPESLLRAEAILEQPKYIHLVRHPVSMIDSFVRHRFDKLLGQPEDEPYESAERTWLERNQTIASMRARVGPGRYHRIRYEDLMAQPEKALRPLCAFLQVPFEDALLTPYAQPQHISGPGDYDIFQHSGLEPRLGSAWQHIHLPQPLDPQTVRLAHEYGYLLSDG